MNCIKVVVKVDDGYSGTDFDRPGIQRLLADAQLGKINIVVVKDLSRFGRNYIEVGRYIDYIFPMYNICVCRRQNRTDTDLEPHSAGLSTAPCRSRTALYRSLTALRTY